MSQSSSTFEIVKSILVEDLEVDEEAIHEETHLLEDIALDSMDTVEIALKIKQRFGVDIKLQVRNDPTVADVCALIDKALANKVL